MSGIRCCICRSRRIIEGYGHSAAPFQIDGVCCDKCNYTIVVPHRLKLSKEISDEQKRNKDK